MSTKKVIGVDVGGVIRHQVHGDPIDGAIECLKELREIGHQVVIISKAKSEWIIKNNAFLDEMDLPESRYPRYFCAEYADKVEIAKRIHCDVMIDDKMAVLKVFPDSIRKIWFCTEQKNLDGAKVYQPDFVQSVDVAMNWSSIADLLMYG